MTTNSTKVAWQILYAFVRVATFLLYCASAALVASAIWLLTSNAVSWLKTARVWPYTNRQALLDIGLALPSTSWLGLQSIVDGVLRWPAWTGALMASTIPLCLAALLSVGYERAERFWRLRNLKQTNDWRRNLERL